MPSKKNQAYLKTWDEYQTLRKSENKKSGRSTRESAPLLLPISIDIDDGIIVRNLLSAAETKRLYLKNRTDIDALLPKAQEIFNDFDSFFAQDNVDGPRPDSPLDFVISCKVVFLFLLPRKNWKFTDHTQISVDNDDPGELNIECTGTVDAGNALLAINHFGTLNKLFKYNLHVTISQKESGKELKTDIIIDPGMDHDDETGD